MNFNEFTDSDYTMVEYFWEEKEDITRWCDWEKKKPLFARDCPEPIRAFNSYIIAKRTISAIIKSWDI